MKKKTLVFILTIITFCSSIVLGVSTVYRIDSIYLQPSILSVDAQTEVDALYENLLNAYNKQSYFSVKEDKAKEVLTGFPYFHLVSFEKSYPNRVIIKVAEYEEVYALPTVSGEEYYILGEDGTVLGVRENYNNRLDGENNLRIDGLTVEGEREGTLY